jgi:hypothetical protein
MHRPTTIESGIWPSDRVQQSYCECQIGTMQATASAAIRSPPCTCAWPTTKSSPRETPPGESARQALCSLHCVDNESSMPAADLRVAGRFFGLPRSAETEPAHKPLPGQHQQGRITLNPIHIPKHIEDPMQEGFAVPVPATTTSRAAPRRQRDSPNAHSSLPGKLREGAQARARRRQAAHDRPAVPSVPFMTETNMIQLVLF